LSILTLISKKSFLIKEAIVIVYFILFANVCIGQQIKGYVYDKITKKPLISASVYFNNTTIGTITDKDGFFEIEKPKINTELVISFLGYEDQIIGEINIDILKIFITEKSNNLDEVTISYNDPLTREQKIKMFKKGFLGRFDNDKCKILNEKDLVLRYNSKEKILRVNSKKPIIILNKYLDYKLEFSLIQFIAEYRSFSSKKVSYFGTTKFSELSNKKRYLKRRRNTYFGSTLHFMRSIYANSLKKNKFGFIKNGMIVNSKTYIETKLINKKSYVKTKADTISIVYLKNKKQSKIIIGSKEFIIDQYGNYSSNPQILFGGEMGQQKTCQMLPLNYSLIRK
jgi:hypothetical protein